MKKIIALFLLGTGSILGQNNYSLQVQNLTPKPPEVAALSKFIDIPPGNYTGTSSVSVPIYTINAYGLTIPISIDYHVSGVKIGQVSSRVGLGWVMNAGNISLSKQTVGQADIDQIPKYDINGFMPEFARRDIDNDYYTAVKANGLDDFTLKDVQPDIYSYNLNGNSGKFAFDSNGVAQLIPYNTIKIIRPNFGYFTLITNDGIKYNFVLDGNQTTSSAYGSQFDRNNYRIDNIQFLNGEKIQFNYRQIHYEYITNEVHNEILKVMTGWACDPDDTNGQGVFMASNSEGILTDIVFPNGQVVFKYSDQKAVPEKRKDIVDDVYCYNIQVRDNLQTVIKNFELGQSYFISPGYVPDINSYSDLFEATYYRLKLDSVNELLSNAQYNFEYNENHPIPHRFSFDTDYWGFYNGANNSNDLPKTLFENRFYGQADKAPNLDYGITGALKKITFPTKGTQEIEYENDDYYYDGSNGNGYFDGLNEDYQYSEFEISTASGHNFNQSYPFNLTGDVDQRIEFNVTPNPLGDCGDCLPLDGTSYVKGELLDGTTVKATAYLNGESRIVFPATTAIPGHSYFLRLKKIGNDTFTASLKISWYKNNNSMAPRNRLAGSLRVKKIVLDDAKGKTIERRFEYKNPSTGFSSGVNHGDELIAYNEIAKLGVKIGPDTHTCTTWMLSNSNGVNLTGVNGKSVGYDYVSEIYTDSSNPSNNFHTLYKFSNDADDNLLSSRIASPFVPREDNSFMRGLVLEKKSFDNNNIIKKEELSTYEFDTHFNQFSADTYDPGAPIAALKIDVTASFFVSTGGVTTINFPEFTFNWKSYRIPSAWVKLTGQETTDYTTNGNLKTSKEYSYRSDYSHTFPTKIKETLNSSEYNETEYIYPQDITSQQGMAQLVAENRTGTPVETTVSRNGNIISREKTIYGMTAATGGLAKPTSAYTAKFPNNLPNLPDIGQLEERITYDQYDTRGNIVQYTPVAGTPTTLVWGYNKTQPIARIENATYAQVAAALGISATTLDTYSEADIIALNNLRGNAAMAGALVTTYTFTPLVGISTITDPKGYTVYYNYDPSGRLQDVRDSDGKILSENEYHYKN